MNFVERSDGATPQMMNLSGAFNITGVTDPSLPINCPGWTNPTPASTKALDRIPPGFSASIQDVRAVAASLYTGHALCIVGPQGCGKSTLLIAIAALCNWDFEIITGDPSAELMDLMGIRLPEGGWLPNGALECFEHGKLLIIEERDSFNASTTTGLNPLIDRTGLRVPYRGETVHSHRNFRLLGTANTVGNGEGLETFVSSQTQTPAANRRWMFRKMDYLSRKEEEAIVRQRCPAVQDEELDVIFSVVEATRSAARDGAMTAMSTGEVGMIADLLNVMSTSLFRDVFDLVFFSKLPAAQAAAVEEMWKTAAGDKLAAAMSGGAQ
ncbi:AAA family ATPase (plasmid) [Flagellatimonas centrodinii]|uniref:AAA family ATPase n=1 Tax=Flagellatimonas centrodinii TaxID=2806210 RepID=UPI001FFA9549|nr:AAA family ATPase [Flagellatimonas centrodinii]ULQ48430.1 AAA family ATPase [Flagellatimonas centrodinii]